MIVKGILIRRNIKQNHMKSEKKSLSSFFDKNDETNVTNVELFFAPFLLEHNITRIASSVLEIYLEGCSLIPK